MSRKTVRVKLPINGVDMLIYLAEDIVTEHEELAHISPLIDTVVQATMARAIDAKVKRKKADEMEADAVTLPDQADTLLGIAPGQSSAAKDTLHHDVTGYRDALLVKYCGGFKRMGVQCCPRHRRLTLVEAKRVNFEDVGSWDQKPPTTAISIDEWPLWLKSRLRRV